MKTSNSLLIESIKAVLNESAVKIERAPFEYKAAAAGATHKVTILLRGYRQHTEYFESEAEALEFYNEHKDKVTPGRWDEYIEIKKFAPPTPKQQAVLESKKEVLEAVTDLGFEYDTNFHNWGFQTGQNFPYTTDRYKTKGDQKSEKRFIKYNHVTGAWRLDDFDYKMKPVKGVGLESLISALS